LPVLFPPPRRGWAV